MKKLILSSLAVVGLSAAFVAPAQAQVIVNSTPPGGSITGAASFTNINGSTSAIAGEVTYPGLVYADDVTVTVTPTGGVLTNDVTLDLLNVATATIDTTLMTSPGSTVEAAVAQEITAATGDVSTQASLIRAWTAGGLD